MASVMCIFLVAAAAVAMSFAQVQQRARMPPFIVTAPIERNYLFNKNDPDERIEFSCGAKGFPAPTLQWYKDGQELQAITHFNRAVAIVSTPNETHATQDSTLVFKYDSGRSSVHYVAGKYKCRASSSSGVVFSSEYEVLEAGIDQDMTCPQQENSEDVLVQDGGWAKYDCALSYESVPDCKISLRRGVTPDDTESGEEVTGLRYNFRHKYNDKLEAWETSIHINAAMEDDKRSLWLEVDNPVIGAKYSCCYGRVGLNHLSAPMHKPVIQIKDGATGLVGESATLKCFFSANPSVTSIRWFRGNRKLSGGRYELTAGGSTLTINDLIVSDRGRYRCEGVNSQGAEGETVDLVIVQRPTFTLASAPMSLNVTRGGDASFRCHPTGIPAVSAANIRWTWNGASLDPASCKLGMPLRCSLTGDGLMVMGAATLGVVACSGTNTRGTTTVSAYLNVLDPVTIESTQANATLSLTSATTIACLVTVDSLIADPLSRVSWLRDGRSVTLGDVYSSRGQAAAGGVRAELVIGAGDEGAAGSYTCVVTDGYSKASDSVSVQAAEPEIRPKVMPAEPRVATMPWWVLAAAACGAALVCVLLAVGCCCCMCGDRGKSYNVEKNEKVMGAGPEEPLYEEYQRPEGTIARGPLSPSRQGLLDAISYASSQDSLNYGGEDGSFIGEYTSAPASTCSSSLGGRRGGRASPGSVRSCARDGSIPGSIQGSTQGSIAGARVTGTRPYLVGPPPKTVGPVHQTKTNGVVVPNGSYDGKAAQMDTNMDSGMGSMTEV